VEPAARLSSMSPPSRLPRQHVTTYLTGLAITLPRSRPSLDSGAAISRSRPCAACWREALIEDAAFDYARPAPLPPTTDDLRADPRAWVELFLAQLADPVIRAAVPGLLLAWQQEEGLYKRFLLRDERDVRALFAQRLAADGVAQHAEAAFDFLADSTLRRAVTLGMIDAEEFCERTADALAPLVHSSWQSDATDSRS
jgi:hypothetical protein